jgi:hypothetical protein
LGAFLDRGHRFIVRGKSCAGKSQEDPSKRHSVCRDNPTIPIRGFADDLASDIRAEYREALGSGLSGPEATDRLLEQSESIRSDPDEGPVFWLALAATQVRLGRLEDRIRDEALREIDSGHDLSRWLDASRRDMRRRGLVLAKLREALLMPARPPVRVRPYRPFATPLSAGDVLSWQLDDGRFLLFRMVTIDEDYKGNRQPIVEILDWLGTALPELETVSGLSRAIPPELPWSSTRPFTIPVSRRLPRQLDILGRVERDEPTPSSTIGIAYSGWETLVLKALMAVETRGSGYGSKP